MNIVGSLQGQAVQAFLKNGLGLVDLGKGRSRGCLLALGAPLLSSSNLSRTTGTACSVGLPCPNTLPSCSWACRDLQVKGLPFFSCPPQTTALWGLGHWYEVNVKSSWKLSEGSQKTQEGGRYCDSIPFHEFYCLLIIPRSYLSLQTTEGSYFEGLWFVWNRSCNLGVHFHQIHVLLNLLGPAQHSNVKMPASTDKSEFTQENRGLI